MATGLAALVLTIAGFGEARADAAVPSTAAPTYGADGAVSAITRLGNTIYLGGTFSNLGKQTGGGAGLSPTTAAVDPALPYVVGSVFAAVPDGSGGLYIGGSFSRVGRFARRNIAHILPNGTVDPAFNANANAQVTALALSGSTLYVGGSFAGTNSIGGANRNRIAALNVTNGSATSWNPDASGAVHALAVSGSTVYAAGDFNGTDSIGGADRNNIAALSATTGSATSWDPNANGEVNALAVSGSRVYAGGSFNVIGGAARNCIAALGVSTGHATSWDPNANGLVNVIAVSGSTVYAGGNFAGANSIGGANRNHIAALSASTGNATGWDPNANGNVFSLALSGPTVYVGGVFSGVNSIGGANRDYLAALDAGTGHATSWNPHAGGAAATIALSGSTVYAGGEFSLMNTVPRSHIAAISAATGRPTSWNPGTNGEVIALAARGSTVYASGDFNMAGGQTRNWFAGFNATSGALTPFNPNANGFADALAVSGDGATVYAGGYFSGPGSIGGANRNYIAALHSSNGTATGWNPNASEVVRALALDGSTIYAGGDFAGTNSIGGAARDHIAALSAATGDATAWNPGTNGTVRSIAVTKSNVYLGGDGFSTAGGASRSNLAAIGKTSGHATAWNPSPDGPVIGLGVDGPTVYATGGFTHIGGAARKYLAGVSVSNGAATAFNPRPADFGYALTASPGAVYAGGAFTGFPAGRGVRFAAFVQKPANTGPPSITGVPAPGHKITCGKGTWSGGTPQTYAYRWLRNGTVIGGATSATYTVKAADSGHSIRCRVTATNLGGSGVATSGPVTIT